jgi:hypothetical protein
MIKRFEQFSENGPELHYYALDWDDNILHMPTKILMDKKMGEEWKPVEVSTSKFAEVRNDKENYRLRNDNPGEAFSEFRDTGSRGPEAFLDDVKSAISQKAFAPSWEAFVKCLSEGAIFAIITARGHNPETLKEACKKYILSGYGGINTEQVISNIKKYNELYKSSGSTDNSKLVDDYLQICRFHPVTFGEGSAANPEQLKVVALNNFIQYVNTEVKKVKKHAQKGSKIKIGFSDDDFKNIEAMISHFGSRDEKGKFKAGRPQSLKIKYTGKPRGQG